MFCFHNFGAGRLTTLKRSIILFLSSSRHGRFPLVLLSLHYGAGRLVLNRIDHRPRFRSTPRSHPHHGGSLCRLCLASFSPPCAHHFPFVPLGFNLQVSVVVRAVLLYVPLAHHLVLSIERAKEYQRLLLRSRSSEPWTRRRTLNRITCKTLVFHYHKPQVRAV